MTLTLLLQGKTTCLVPQARSIIQCQTLSGAGMAKKRHRATVSHCVGGICMCVRINGTRRQASVSCRDLAAGDTF